MTISLARSSVVSGPIKKSYVTQWYDIHGKMMDAVENFGVPKNSETVSLSL